MRGLPPRLAGGRLLPVSSRGRPSCVLLPNRRTSVVLDEGHTLTTSFHINYLSQDPISRDSPLGSWGCKIGVFREHSSVPKTAPLGKFKGTQTSLVRESVLWMAGLCSEAPQARTLAVSRCPSSGSVDSASGSLLCSGTRAEKQHSSC